MAKGNNGNYLQHSIEVESAVQLAKTDGGGRLHIAFTHGMAPYEPLDSRRKGPARDLLKSALTAASQPQTPDETPVVTAYRKTGASTRRYPNSAELLGAVVGRDKLSGGITERDGTKYRQLASRWSDSCVVPVCSSWRCQVGPGGGLTAPNDLQTPWLFSMDPMTYDEPDYKDDDRLYRADRDRLSVTLSHFTSSRTPGIATLFVYKVRAEKRDLFWDFMDELAKRTRAKTRSYWVGHQREERNLCGLLYTGMEVSHDLRIPGITVGRN